MSFFTLFVLSIWFVDHRGQWCKGKRNWRPLDSPLNRRAQVLVGRLLEVINRFE
jgi:hypothetical protein